MTSKALETSIFEDFLPITRIQATSHFTWKYPLPWRGRGL